MDRFVARYREYPNFPCDRELHPSVKLILTGLIFVTTSVAMWGIGLTVWRMTMPADGVPQNKYQWAVAVVAQAVKTRTRDCDENKTKNQTKNSRRRSARMFANIGY